MVKKISIYLQKESNPALLQKVNTVNPSSRRNVGFLCVDFQKVSLSSTYTYKHKPLILDISVIVYLCNYFERLGFKKVYTQKRGVIL